MSLLTFTKKSTLTVVISRFCFLLLMLPCNTGSLLAQSPQQVMIGSAGGPSNFWFGPVYRNTGNPGLLNFSRHAYIYTAAELGIPSGSKIVKMEWIKSSNATITGNNVFNIWLTNSTATTFPSTMTWNTLVSAATQVFSSTNYAITGAANTYMSAPFSDTFTYQGGSLQILTNWAKVGVASASLPFYIQTAAGKTLGIASTTPLTGSAILQAANYGGSRPNIRITYLPVPPCSGIPMPGRTLSSVPSICPGVSFTLSMETEVPGGGITYQWEKADDSLFTSNVVNLGTSSTFSTTQTSNTYYRCKVSCASGGPSVGYSDVLLMPMAPSYGCYCQSSALSDADEDIFKFKFGTRSNCSDCASQATGQYSVKNLYSNYQYLPASIVQKGSAVPFSIEIGTCGTGSLPNRCAIFVDYNQNNIFEYPDEQVYATSGPITGPHTESGTITIPTTAFTGLTGLRVINIEQNSPITSACGIYSWGETEDYVIDIIGSGACNGSPQPGHTQFEKPGDCQSYSGTASVCSGTSVLLSVQNPNQGNGITYQWLKNGNPISGATSPTYNSPPIISEESYSCILTCTNSGLSTTSIPILIDMNTYLNCYCSSRPGGNTDEDIFSVTLNGVTNTSSCTVTAPGPGSILNQYSNFTTNGPLTNIELGTSVPFSLYVDDCDIPPAPYYTFSTMIWIDFNHNGSFTDAGELVFSDPTQLSSPRNVTGNINVPCTALEGITRMRISVVEGLNANQITPCMNYGFGETEDYLINLTPKSHNVIFNFGTTTAPTASATSGTPVSNLSFSAITQGNNANTSQGVLLINNTNPSNYTGASGQMRAGITARNRSLQVQDTSAYMQLTLTPASGFRVVVDSIAFGSISHQHGPTQIDIRSSLDNYTTSLATIPVVANSSWAYHQVGLLNAVSTSAVHLRIYGSVPGGNGSVTTGNTPANWFIDDIRIKGAVKCSTSCALQASASFTPIACQGGTTSLQVNAWNGSGQLQYKLNGGSFQTGNTFSNLSAGTYTIVIKDDNACEVTVVRVINQPATVVSDTTVSACDTYTWNKNGMTYSATGIYTSTGLTTAGCIRFDTLRLTMNYSTTLPSDTIIACGPVTWNGQVYTQSGVYNSVSLNASGCPQTQTLVLTITPVNSSTIQVTACDNYTWILNGLTYSLSGSYQYVQGCDTTTLQLTIINSSLSIDTVSACGSYVWLVNNTTYTQSGVYTYTTGCQTMILHVTIIPLSSSSQQVSTCAQYLWPVNNTMYTNSGIYSHTDGCHTYTLNLTVTPLTNSTTSISVCNSYTWAANNITYTTSGNYTHVNGCHTSTLVLNITPSTSSSSTVSACGSYLWPQNGMTYTNSGNYSHVVNCHTYTLALTITPITADTQQITACNNYYWPITGISYTNSGSYTFINGCHTSNLNLTINSSTSSSITATSCGSYYWALSNTTYTASGVYTHINGCHTTTLNLTVTPFSSSSETITSCQSYVWQIAGVTYTNSGTYTFVQGCHTYQLILTIIPYTSTVQNVNACNSYTWIKNNVTYTTSGTYIQQSGCHTDTLQLIIQNSTSVTTTISACGSYTWPVNGISYSASGNYQFVAGCDTNNLVLSITPLSSTNTNLTACFTYTWPVNGITYTQSGTYVAINGCHTDSLQLQIATGSPGYDTVTACNTYTWVVNGTTYSNSGIYTFISNCNTSTLNLTILPSSGSNMQISACNSYYWQPTNTTYTQSGSYIHVTGCDTSILQLSIQQGTHNTQQLTACDSYMWPLNMITYTNSGTYMYINGCDTSELELTILPSASNNENQTACQSFTWPLNGITYTATGIYTHINNCIESVLNLTILTNTTDSIMASSCDSYLWQENGITYTSSGFYINQVGCHTRVLSLTITNSVTDTMFISACDLYTWPANGITYSSSGVYSATSGCLTNVLVLSITGSTQSTVSITTCGSYVWPVNGITYTATGTYTHVVGCHQNTLQLTSIASSSSNQITSACQQYTWPINGMTYTNSGVYAVINGCQTDSLSLTILSGSTNTTSISACDSYTWSATNTTYTQSGIYVHTVNCDTMILNVSIQPGTTDTIQISSCNIYTWPANGTTYSASGMYVFTNACHVQVLQLTIIPGGITTVSASACDSYLWPITNQVLTQSGMYTHTVGCQIYELQLTILTSTTQTHTVSSCVSYIWPVNGITYTASGIYSHSANCVSSTLVLTINTPSSSATTMSAIGSYTWPISTLTYNSSGTYIHTSLNAQGCIHSDTLYLSIQTNLTISLLENQPISCHGNNDGSLIASATGDQPFIYNLDGGSFSNTTGLFFGLLPGMHTICVKDVHGNITCDSLFFYEPDPLTMNFFIDSVISCHGNDGAVFADITGGTNLLQGYLTWWMNSNGDTINDVINDNFALYLQQLSAGTYTVAIEDDNGCFFSKDFVLLPATPIQVQPIFTPIACGNTSTSVQLNASGGVPYEPYTFTVNGQTPVSSYSAGTYTIVATDAKGCSGSSLLTMNEPAIYQNVTAVSCASYTWNVSGLTYTQSGTYSTTQNNAVGCDTIVTLSLQIHQPTFMGDTIVSACHSYTWHGVSYSVSGNYTHTSLNTNGCINTATLYLTITTCTSSPVLNLSLLLQGYYDMNGVMVPALLNQGESATILVTDSVDIELRSPNWPYPLFYSEQALLYTDGSAQINLPVSTGMYFIVIKHRNTIETWSANPVDISLGSYDFTTSTSQAYGNNLIELESGIFGLYTGDINADNNLDLIDQSELDFGIDNFLFGYEAIDLNGDGNVDLLDSIILDENISNFIYSIQP